MDTKLGRRSSVVASTVSDPSLARTPGPSIEATTLKNPAFQAFWLLRLGFTIAPILFGADKFAHVMVNWDIYLAPRIVTHLPWTAHQVMYGVGAVEILAGLIVLARPRFGGYLVTAWLGGIIINLLLIPGFYDIALRDFGLLLGALTLARLSVIFDRPIAARMSRA